MGRILLPEWRNRTKRYSLVPVPAPNYFVDANRGSDSNNGTSKLTPWATLTKARDTAAARAAGVCVALANDSTFNLSDRLSWSQAGGTPANGSSEAVRWYLTNYDPTGAYPNDRPTVTFYYTPASNQWTWDGAAGAWYFSNPYSRAWTTDCYVYFPRAKRFGENWNSVAVSSLTADFRVFNGTGGNTSRLYVYAPPSVDPTTYYGGPGSIELGEGEGAALSFSRCGNWAVVDGIHFSRCGLAVTQSNFSGTQNLDGFVIQRCTADYCARLFYGASDANSAYTMGCKVLENTLMHMGSGGLHTYCKAANWLVAGNYWEDCGNTWSTGGLYAQEGASGASGLVNNVAMQNYAADMKFGLGGLTFDGCALYADPGALGWIFDNNWGEDMRCFIQQNNGQPLSVLRNVTNNVDRFMSISDATGRNNLSSTVEGNTCFAAQFDRYLNNGNVSQGQNVGLIYMLNAGGSTQTLNLYNNSLQTADGVSIPGGVRALDSATINAGGNHIGSGVTDLIVRSGGATSNTGLAVKARVPSYRPNAAAAHYRTGTHRGVCSTDADGRVRADPPTPGAYEPVA